MEAFQYYFQEVHLGTNNNSITRSFYQCIRYILEVSKKGKKGASSIYIELQFIFLFFKKSIALKCLKTTDLL